MNLMKISNSNHAKFNLILAKLFIHIHYHLKCLTIRADYRYKLYLSRTNVYIKAMREKA